MISPENTPVQRTDRAAAAKETSDLKTRKSPNARKEFKEVAAEREDENLIDPVSEKNAVDEKDDSLMSFFAKQPKKQIRSNLKTELEQKLSFQEDVKEDPSILQVSPGTKKEAKLSNEVDIKEKKDALSFKKEGSGSQYSESQPDISFLNQIAGMQAPVTNNPINLSGPQNVEQTVSIASPIETIVAELVEKLLVVQQEGKTDTVVQLNAPGIFQGAIVVISQFDTAQGQLNLAFENLKNEAKNLLDSLPNRDSLLVSLSEKGYVVQQFTTTTIAEHAPFFGDMQKPMSREQTDEQEKKQNKEENG